MVYEDYIMSFFSSIPIRQEGTEILAAWFNTIRSKLITFFGTGSVGQTEFAGSASQTNTDVTDLLFDNTVTESAEVFYTLKTATLFMMSSFAVRWDGTDWVLSDGPVHFDNAGITFAIDASTGQVDYTSGAETFTMQYRIISFDI